MIILGNKYNISKNEKNILLEKVKHIHNIDIKNVSDADIVNEIKKYVDTNEVEFLVLNLDRKVSMHIKSYLEELDYCGIKIMLYSEFTSKFFNRCHIGFNEKNYEVYESIHDKTEKDFAKQIFDVLFSSFALLVLSPLFVIISILIKVKSPNGPVIFGHQRIGKDGKFFRVYKFRTMVPDAQERLQKLLDENPDIREEYEKDFKLKDDPRIIPGIGNFLRESSMDELPQFFNSLIGNMSVVGPRPIVEDEVAKYGKYAVKFFSVKPGVTGLWQVSGRNDINYDERVALDMQYIDNQSFWMDIQIIIKTVSVMIFRKGAY